MFVVGFGDARCDIGDTGMRGDAELTLVSQGMELERAVRSLRGAWSPVALSAVGSPSFFRGVVRLHAPRPHQ
jgi:hypothetical protein